MHVSRFRQRLGYGVVLALLAVVASARPALAQGPLTISLNGPNPTVLECPAAYVEMGATVSGGLAPYNLTITGTVDSHEPGTYIITYTATDAAGNTAVAFRTVIVQDTTPPNVDASVGISMLWPPNHNLVNVGLSALVTDACDPAPVIRTFVFGDEDDEEQTGDGHHSPDAKDIALGSLRLRSERKGNADGRVYLILVTATDESGNVGFDCTTVVVPHDNSKKSIASVNGQAAAAMAQCATFVRFVLGQGGLPAGFFVVGDGPTLGPKQ